MGNAPFFYLREDERVVLQGRPAPSWALVLFVQLALPAILLLGAAYVVVVLVMREPRAIPFISGGFVVLLAGAALWSWRRAATTEFAVTDARIYARTGRLRTSVHFTTHDKVTDIHYRQGALDRLAGLGAIVFATAGGAVGVPGVRDALQVKAAAERARDAFVRRLLDASGVAAVPGDPDVAPAVAPAPDAPVLPLPPPWSGPRPAYVQEGDVVLWQGKPRLVAALPAAAPLAAMFFFAAVSMPRAEGPAALFLPILLLLGAASAGSRALALSMTEYTVTQRRVYARSGIVGTKIAQLTYDKITDIAYEQNLLGRVLGYAGVTVNTASGGQAPLTMVGLRDAVAAKELVEQARDRYLQEARR